MLVDNANWEAVATAHILKAMFIQHVSHEPEFMPHILLDVTLAVAEDLEGLVVICTNGIFSSRYSMETILSAGARRVPFLPVLLDENFLPHTGVHARPAGCHRAVGP